MAKALASGRRAEIVDVLAQGERSVEEIAAEIDQSVANTSHHLRALARAGCSPPDATAPASTTRWPATGSATCGPRCATSPKRMWPGSRSSPPPTSATATASSRRPRRARGPSPRAVTSSCSTFDPTPSSRPVTSPAPGRSRSASCAATCGALPKDTDVVAYCRGPYCVYADDAVRELNRKGFKARRLIDGFPEWKRAPRRQVGDLP